MELVRENQERKPSKETDAAMIKVVVAGSGCWGKNFEQTNKSKMRSR
jgi:hypothetical protein